jgi:hypothetical protein
MGVQTIKFNGRKTKAVSGGRDIGRGNIMADVLAPAQKMDGPAPLAGQNLVELSNLGKTPAQQGGTDKVAAAASATDTSVLTPLQLTDNSQPAAVPAKAAENVAPAPVAQPDAVPAKIADNQVSPAAAPAAQIADNQVSPAAAPAAQIADNQAAPAAAGADCEKSTACSFTPTTDRDKSKPWWDARAQIVGTAPDKDANCLYKVQFGDDLSTIAQRQLHAEGKAVNRDSLKAEEDKLVKLNDAQYKSLDCNKHYLQAGWRLKLTDDCAATPAPAPVEKAPLPAPAPNSDKTAPPARVEAPLPPPARVEAPLPPAGRVEAPLPPASYDGRVNCDYPGTDSRYQDANHIYLQYGREIHFGHQGQRPFRLEPGESILYRRENGREQLITGCNQDGSQPRHSHLRYEYDSQGQRYDLNLNDQQQQVYYQRLAPEFMPNYQGAPVQDRYSIQERRANEERKIQDDEARRLDAEHKAAERHNQLVQPALAPLPPKEVRVTPSATSVQSEADRINSLPTEAERTKARAEYMHKTPAQKEQDRIDHTQQQQVEAAPPKPQPQAEVAKPQVVAQPKPQPQAEVAKPQVVAPPTKPAATSTAAKLYAMP